MHRVQEKVKSIVAFPASSHYCSISIYAKHPLMIFATRPDIPLHLKSDSLDDAIGTAFTSHFTMELFTI